MLEQVNDPIQVSARFEQGKLLPLKFVWNSREYVISKINLAWHHFEGRGKIYYFAVSDSVNYFKLQFDSDTLNWTLLECYVD